MRSNLIRNYEFGVWRSTQEAEEVMIFGSDNFILPAMASIILCFVGMKKHDENKRKERLGKAEKTIS